MDHLSAALLAGSQHCSPADCMGDEGGMEGWRDGGMRRGEQEKNKIKITHGIPKKEKKKRMDDLVGEKRWRESDGGKE